MYTKNQNISEIEENEIINDIFIIKSKLGILPYSNNTKLRFELKLKDVSGEILLKFWGDEVKESLEKIYGSLNEGDAIHVQGRAKEFGGVLEINVESRVHEIKILNENEFCPESFIKKSKRDVNVMFEELYRLANSISNQELQQIVLLFLEDESWVKKFKQTPASMFRHYNWAGGLLEQTLVITKLSLDVAKYHPKLKSDLLIAGAILHDIGKMDYFEIKTSIEISTKGQLLGHVILGIEMFDKKLQNKGFISSKVALKLKHIISSHLGRKAYGSPVTPSFPEALVISQTKLLDSKTNGMISIIEESNKDNNLIHHKDFGMVYIK
jgi:3'-5' exoribonuclease